MFNVWNRSNCHSFPESSSSSKSIGKSYSFKKVFSQVAQLHPAQLAELQRLLANPGLLNDQLELSRRLQAGEIGEFSEEQTKLTSYRSICRHVYRSHWWIDSGYESGSLGSPKSLSGRSDSSRGQYRRNSAAGKGKIWAVLSKKSRWPKRQPFPSNWKRLKRIWGG